MGFLGNEPAAIAGAIQLGFAMLVALGWIHLTDMQIGSIMAFLSAVLALIVRQSVVPLQLARERMAEGRDPLTPRNDK